MIASVYNLSREDFSRLNISDDYSIHRIVYNLFPNKRSNAEKTRQMPKGFLFVDKGGSWDRRQILILSDRKPLQPQIGKITSKTIPEHFLEHDFYGFEIVLNPTKRSMITQKTIVLRKRQDLISWFLNKMPNQGFLVDQDSLQVEKIGVQQFDKKNTTVTHGTATFKGKLKVIDQDKFKKSFKQGIGRARGFGFGLLQIVPIQIHNEFNNFKQKEGYRE